MEKINRLILKARGMAPVEVAPFDWAGDLIRDGFGLDPDLYAVETPGGTGYDLVRALDDACNCPDTGVTPIL
jgi:hypothetical protein